MKIDSARKILLSVAATLALSIGPFSLPAFAENLIPYVKNLTIKVGESAVIHGVRGACGQPPKNSQFVAYKLKTGTISYGAQGVRNSKKCGGKTPAVEVIFTATAPGKETFKVEGDTISVKVKE